MVRRIIHLLPAIELIEVDIVLSEPTKRNEFIETLNGVKSVMTFITKILPILSSVSQWTQVLSSNTFPTLPLIRFACARIFADIEK